MREAPTEQQIKIMVEYAGSIKRGQKLVEDMSALTISEQVSTFLFAAVLCYWPYVKEQEHLPEDLRMNADYGARIGQHLATTVTMLGLTLGLIKSDEMFEQLARGEDVYAEVQDDQAPH